MGIDFVLISNIASFLMIIKNGVFNSLIFIINLNFEFIFLFKDLKF